MRDASAFDGTAFLGLARRAKRDPYRLALFAAHLDPDEVPLAFLPVQGGTVVVTDRRILEMRAHLDVHGPWNVKEFLGYEVRRSWARADIRGIQHLASRLEGGVEDRIVLTTPEGDASIVVSRGPEATLAPEDVDALRAAVLRPQA
jgi:hypothetical protein